MKPTPDKVAPGAAIVPFDQLDVALLESQGPVAIGSRATSQRSSISSGGGGGDGGGGRGGDSGGGAAGGETPGAPGAPAASTVIELEQTKGDLPGFYRVDEDVYLPYNLYGGNAGDGSGKLAALPASTTGSLSSIIATSIESSEQGDQLRASSCFTASLAGDVAGGGGDAPEQKRVLDQHHRAAGVDGAALGAADDRHDTGAAAGAAGAGEGGGGDAGAEGAGPDGGDGAGPVAAAGRIEKSWQTTVQIAVPFFFAGFGTIAAGIILGRVEVRKRKKGRTTHGIDIGLFTYLSPNWNVFTQVSELFILVPALLGLKGNLDMCLASRLSTQANLGNLNDKREIIHMVIGNIALVQVQAIVASFIVSIFAIIVGAIMNQSFLFSHAMLITASSMFTATSSCFILDFVLVGVILFTKRFDLNPDNLATPLAASIGDVVSISILSFMASTLFNDLNAHMFVTFLMIGAYFVLLPFLGLVVYRNKYTSRVLTSGWGPVLISLFISGMGGLVLDTAVGMFNGFVVFQPIINGIGGNLVSVQASKISTMLHQSSILGIIPPHAKILEAPWKALFRGVPYAKTARILIMMSIPGQVLFIFVADYIHMSRSTIGLPFVLTYLFVSTLQIMLLLYIAHVIIHLMWKLKIDPDNSAIPYLTALGDLFGSSFLMLAFLFLRAIGHPYGEEYTEQVEGFPLLSTEPPYGNDTAVLTGLIHEASGL